MLAVPLLAGGAMTAVAAGSASAGAPYSCDQTATNAACGPYQNPSVVLGTNQTDNVVQDEWNAGCTCGTVTSQELKANSSSDWQVSANITGNGAVMTSPEDQVTPQNWTGTVNLPVPVADYSSINSTFSDTLPSNPGASDDYEAMYDIWLGDATQQQWTGDQEIMVWTDNHGQTPAGTDTGKTWTDASTGVVYEIWVDSGTATTLGNDDIVSFAAKTQHASGSVDLLALFKFLQSGGYSTGPMGIDQVTNGFELCDTSGQAETFTVSNYTISATGDGQNGAPGGGTVQQAPVATTNAATNVASSGATLNGSVNPEGADASYKFDYGTTSSYGSSTTAGDAGSGSSAVSESADLTGLQPSTTYHYRIEATNSGGTSYGSDQVFTTAAAGGGGGSGAVTFDSVAGAKAANTGSLSWTHTVGTGTDRALLVEAATGVSSDGGCSVSVTDNGTALTKLDTVHTNNQTAGFLTIWGLAAPPSGANAIAVHVTGCNGGTPEELTGGSESFAGVSQSGPFSAVTNATGASGNPTASITTPASDLTTAFAANGSAIGTLAQGGKSRFTENQDNNSGAGNSAGGTAGTGTVHIGWNTTSDWWGEGILYLNHD